MARRETPRDGFFSKVLVASIVVIWVALVGGNWIGHFAIEKGMLGKTDETEFKNMPGPRPKPWLTVDSRIQQELEQNTGITPGATPGTPGDEASNPTPDESTPAQTATPGEAIPVKPVEEQTPAEEPTPKAKPKPTPAQAAKAPEPKFAEPVEAKTPKAPKEPKPAREPEATPVAEAPPATPALAEPASAPATPAAESEHAQDKSPRQLQFGSFSSQENAKRLQDELSRQGQDARVEEIQTSNGKIYRVRGGSYNEEQAQQQREKLKEKNVDAYIVNP